MITRRLEHSGTISVLPILFLLLLVGLALPARADIIQHTNIQVTTGIDNPAGTSVDTEVPEGQEGVEVSISSEEVCGAVFNRKNATLTVNGKKLGNATVTLRWTDNRGRKHEQTFSVDVVKGRNDRRPG